MEIRIAHEVSRGTYGAPRVHAELAAKGIRVGRKRVARLMSQHGLAGVSRRKFVITTVKGGNRQAPDLVERNFTAPEPDRLWVADITYVPTWAGFLYLAVVTARQRRLSRTVRSSEYEADKYRSHGLPCGPQSQAGQTRSQATTSLRPAAR
jgi:transposase InsO family protein